MFEHLRDYRGVIVTGAHRSGTTICGRMVAYDLDRRYVTESQIQRARGRLIDSRYMQDWIDGQGEPWVLHGATCYAWIADLQREDVATLFVRRPFEEITASQVRAQGKPIDNPERKLERWEEMAADGTILNPFSLQYHDLKAHSMWAEDREGWETRQISATETAFDTEGFR